MMNEGLLIFLCWLPPVLLAITLHESAHGFVARYFGDPTAQQAGRITLNPLRHIDPVGTVIVPAVLYWSSAAFGSALLFGWAKPVPVDFSRLRHPKTDMIWVAAAGPLINLFMALCWMIVLVFVFKYSDNKQLSGFADALRIMAQGGVQINIVLFIFNLFPIPPLDGGRIVTGLLPMALARPFARLELFGMLIVLVLLLTGIVSDILRPLFNILFNQLLSFVSIFI